MSDQIFTTHGDMTDAPCVYEVWRDGKCLYVGQTNNLRRRFLEHKFEWDTVVARVVADRGKRLKYEESAIAELRPCINVQRPHIRKKVPWLPPGEVWGIFSKWYMP